MLVLGPESTATRWIADTLSMHPDVALGTSNHKDPLDEFWSTENTDVLLQAVATGTIVSRRSVPSGVDDAPAEFMSEPPLNELLLMCENTGVQVHILVTSRLRPATVLSGATNRASCQGSLVAARQQYEWAYRSIFALILGFPSLSFTVLSVESLVLDAERAFESLFVELGMAPFRPSVKANTAINDYALSVLPALRSAKRAVPGATLRFTENGSGLDFLGLGWGRRERNGVWSVSRRAFIAIPYPERRNGNSQESDQSLQIELVPYIDATDAEAASERFLTVIVDLHTEFHGPISGHCNLLLPIRLRAPCRDLMVIEFQLIDANGSQRTAKESALTPEDPRVFGVKLVQLTFGDRGAGIS